MPHLPFFAPTPPELVWPDRTMLPPTSYISHLNHLVSCSAPTNTSYLASSLIIWSTFLSSPVCPLCPSALWLATSMGPSIPTRIQSLALLALCAEDLPWEFCKFSAGEQAWYVRRGTITQCPGLDTQEPKPPRVDSAVTDVARPLPRGGTTAHTHTHTHHHGHANPASWDTCASSRYSEPMLASPSGSWARAPQKPIHAPWLMVWAPGVPPGPQPTHWKHEQ